MAGLTKWNTSFILIGILILIESSKECLLDQSALESMHINVTLDYLTGAQINRPTPDNSHNVNVTRVMETMKEQWKNASRSIRCFHRSGHFQFVAGYEYCTINRGTHSDNANFQCSLNLADYFPLFVLVGYHSRARVEWPVEIGLSGRFNRTCVTKPDTVQWTEFGENETSSFDITARCLTTGPCLRPYVRVMFFKYKVNDNLPINHLPPCDVI